MKKHLYNLLCLGLSVLALSSCGNDDNLDPIGNWELSEPELLSPEDNSDLLLLEDRPNENFYFEWNKAVSSANFQVRYQLQLDSVGSTDDDTPILSVVSNNNGKSTSASLTASEIDLALSYAGFPANEVADVEWRVVAISQDTKAYASRNIQIKRFENEYVPVQLFIAGEATEVGDDIASAIPMRTLTDTEGNPTYIFEAYTSLQADAPFKLYSKQELPAHVYGGGEGDIEKNGTALSADETAVFRITVNLNDNTYSLLKIEKWSVVGNVIPNAWGGDEPLDYIGNGQWQAQLSLSIPDGEDGGFIFRANENWDYVIKRIQGTSNEVYMESQAGDAGIGVEDIPLSSPGDYTVTLDLSGSTYTYELETEANPPSETPQTLFLFANGESVAEFSLDGDMFSSDYLPLQAGVAYTLNSSQDGSGTNYYVSDVVGVSDNPNGDSVAGNLVFLEGEGDFTIDHDQAYQLSFNFSSGNLSWQYYNIKLFHWDPNDWDGRDEILMTYVHPLKYTTTHNLEDGYDLKFNSPWDVELGVPEGGDTSATSGNLVHGGANLNCISETESYEVHLEVDSNYETGTYEFIQQ